MNWLKKAVFQLYALAYELVTTTHPHKKMMQKIAEFLEGKVMDIGCGTGPLIAYLPKRVNEYWAVDPDEGMLKRQERKELSCSRVQVRGSVQNVSQVVHGSFDVIVTSNSLYTWEDPPRDLKKVHDLLKPGGKLVLTNPREESGQFKVFVEHMRWVVKEGGHFKAMTYLVPRILHIMFIMGLNVVITVMGKKKEYYFPSREELTALLEEVGFEIDIFEETYAGQAWFIVASKRRIE